MSNTDAPAPPQGLPQRRKPRRPALILVGVVLVAFRVGRDVISDVLYGRYGVVGAVLPFIALGALLIGWRLWVHHRARNGEQFTPERIRQQIVDSGLPGPAFDENDTLVGSSVLVVNQRPKLIEVVTEYGLFGHDGEPRGTIRQIGQSRLRRFFRFVTPFDQYFTHHFEIADADGTVALRLTRPRKLFRTKVHVFDGDDRYLGRLRQENVFFKIRFAIEGPDHRRVGRLHAENWRAWDFQLLDWAGTEVGRVVKSWEGMANFVFTQADLYVVRFHEELDEPFRRLALAGALSVDLALKQDPQGLNG